MVIRDVYVEAGRGKFRRQFLQFITVIVDSVAVIMMQSVRYNEARTTSPVHAPKSLRLIAGVAQQSLL